MMAVASARLVEPPRRVCSYELASPHLVRPLDADASKCNAIIIVMLITLFVNASGTVDMISL